MSLKRFFRRARWDDERARELEAHLAIEIDEHIARGMSPQDARLAARRKLGSPARIREEIYDFKTVPIVATARAPSRRSSTGSVRIRLTRSAATPPLSVTRPLPNTADASNGTAARMS